jgi:hypothetical protein
MALRLLLLVVGLASPTEAVFLDRRALLGAASAAAVTLTSAPRTATAASKIADADARKQIAAGYTALDKLLGEFGGVTEREGGDGVRRILGTVGASSPVYRVEVAFRSLTEAADDPPEYLDGLEELMRNLADADSQAYSANFIAFSSAKGTPEQYFGLSKAAVARARKEWGTLMKRLGMEEP